MQWQARIFGRPLGPPRPTRAEAIEDLVATGHATKDDYAPFRVWPIVPAEVVKVRGAA